MGDVAARRNSGNGSGGSWQPRGRGRGFFRGNGTSGGRFNGSRTAGALAALLPVVDTQSSQQVITDLLEVNQGPYSGWKLYHKQESPHSTEQRKRRSPNWGEAETLLLLRLWAERVQEMKTTKRNGFMLEEMAQLLQTQGFSRSSTEVKTRIANLSQEYRMELRKRSLGFPHGSFKLWDAVHAILGPEESANFQAGVESGSQQGNSSEQAEQQQYVAEQWQHEQHEQQSGESAEALCCDIDPGMLMGQQESGEEDEDSQSETDEMPPLHHNPLNGLPNVPPSLTISLTPAPSSNGTTSCPPPALTRMPALIRVATKRSSQDSNPPPPPLVRKSVGKRPRLSLDSAMLTKEEEPVKPEPHNNNCEEFPQPSESGWALVAEQLRIANQIAENRNNNLTLLMEQQIKLQRQGLQMTKRILSLLENMQPSPEHPHDNGDNDAADSS